MSSDPGDPQVESWTGLEVNYIVSDAGGDDLNYLFSECVLVNW